MADLADRDPAAEDRAGNQPALPPTKHQARRARTDPEATEALIGLAAEPPGGESRRCYDHADVSAAALGERCRDAPWWDGRAGGLRLAGRCLAGASLRGANLSRADLTGADLGGAGGSKIVLTGARLEEASLRDADLIGGELTEVDAGEADFSGALLEDAKFARARLRFARFTGAVMDGADLSSADLWGARLDRIEAERACFGNARLDEAQMQGADVAGADFGGATLRRARLSDARFRGANLRDAVLDGADLGGADLSGAVLPHVSLASCTLRHARFANAWLERTRMRASQLCGAAGEEAAGEWEAAIESYIVLEQNFRSLGSAQDASWAFRRRRRMGKRLHGQRAAAALADGKYRRALLSGFAWLNDSASEWLCDYGESVGRVLRAFLIVLIGFAALYWFTGCLEPRDPMRAAHAFRPVDYLLFSLDSMTTVGTSEVGLKPAGQLGVLVSSVQTVLGTVLLGLFGFVLGVRMRN